MRAINALTALTFLMIALTGATAASAQDVTVIGTHGAWTAYSYQEDSGIVCYMASEPTKAEGNYTRRGDVFALVTHRPSEDSMDVVSIVAGYAYKENSDATVSVGSSSYEMFTNGERAWNRDEATDKAMVQAMIRGSSLTVKGTSSRDTLTTDTYSLSGFTAAHKDITTACTSG
ncbi:MAG: invasion associated locus B family protein [Rhodospirillaceae bacterium]